MASQYVEDDSFLLSKEIEIKEREANLLRIVMRCKKLGIDISEPTLVTEDDLQENVTIEAKMTHISTRIRKEELPSNAASGYSVDADELMEPRIEDFGLSEERLKEATQIPIMPTRIFKPLASLKPKPYRQKNSESTDGSPCLSLRTVPFGKISSNDVTFDCTPEVCHKNKKSKTYWENNRGRNNGMGNLISPVITPKLNLREQRHNCPVGQTHLIKRESLVSPEEPELTSTMNQLKFYANNICNTNSVGKQHLAKTQSLVSPEEPELTGTMKQLNMHVINENNNAFLMNAPDQSASSLKTPEEPDFVISTKNEDFSFSNLQLPQSPQITVDWLTSDVNMGTHLF